MNVASLPVANAAPEVSEQTARCVGTRPSLLSLLVEAGIVTSEEQLRIAAAAGRADGERLADVALRERWIDEEGLARLLARQWNLSFVDQEAVAAAVVERAHLSPEQARRAGACVVRFEDGVQSAVVADPTSDRLNELRASLGASVAVAVVTDAALGELLRRLGSEAFDDVPAAEPEAAAEEPTPRYDAEVDAVIPELQAATAAVAALGERLEQLAAAHREGQRELAELRGELERAKEERDHEQALARERQQELDGERAQRAATKAKLVDVIRGLDG